MNHEPLKYFRNGILAGDRRVLAKAITLVESRHPKHRKLKHQLVEQLKPHTGQAIRLGITGVPGVGKSSFIESFGMLLVNRGHQVAVLAVSKLPTQRGKYFSR